MHNQRKNKKSQTALKTEPYLRAVINTAFKYVMHMNVDNTIEQASSQQQIRTDNTYMDSTAAAASLDSDVYAIRFNLSSSIHHRHEILRLTVPR